MSKISTSGGLREAIILLEIKRKNEELQLREQLHTTFESARPVNLIRSAYQEVVANQDLKDNLVNTSVGLAVGYISERLFEGKSHSPLRKLLGTALLFGVTNVVRKNPEAIKAMAKGLFNLIHTKRAVATRTE